MLGGLARETLSALYSDLAFSQDGSSEEFIGEWVEKRDVHDQLVIATKVRAGSVSAPIVANLHAYLKYTAIYEREQKLHWQPRKVVHNLYSRFFRKTTHVLR